MADGGAVAPAQGQQVMRAYQARVPVLVRTMRDDEADALGAVFFRAVHHGAARAYAPEQLQAWAPHAPSGAAWAARLAEQSTVVAEIDDRLRGFMTLSMCSGHLDMAFVEKGAQGQGVTDAMYLVIENRARAAGLRRLTSDASHLARPFFERMGWRVLAAQEVERDGVTLQNWQMEKVLT